jgi:hypothetical protein
MYVLTTSFRKGCDGLTTITATIDFKLIVPTAVSTAISTLNTVLTTGGVTNLPDITALLSTVSIPDTVIDISAMNKFDGRYDDVAITLSDKLPTDKEKILNLLGIELTITIELSRLTLFKKGMEIPIKYKLEILKKTIMKFPSSLCGAKGSYP